MFTELFNDFLKASNEYGGVVRYWLGTSLQIIISDLRDIEVFMYC